MRYVATVALMVVISAHAHTGTPLAQQSATERFDVVSVRENTGTDLSIRSEPTPADGYRRTNVPLSSHVTFAFDIPQPSRIAGLPDWTRNTRYDIVGKAAGPITDQQRRAMMRELLVTRFKLRTHTEQREQAVYVMTTSRPDKSLGPGLKLRPECGHQPCASGGTGTPQGLKLQAVTMARLADGMLSNLLRQIVRDETGLPDYYDVEASWRPVTGQVDPADTRPDVFTAFREQLGLKLEASRRMVDVLIIDQIERPTEN